MSIDNTCRFCKDWKDEGHYPMVKYGVRHYAHADCALKAKGAEFFDRLSEHQLSQFPYFAAKEAGLAADLEKRLGL